MRWYYGWTIVVALGATIAVSYGTMYYSMGAFLTPMREETGWSAALVSGAVALNTLVGGLLGVLVGRLTDRHGARLVMSAGSLAGAAGLLLFSFSQGPWMLYLAWGVVVAAGSAGSFYNPAFTAIAAWFEEKRGSALGLLTFLGGFAAVIFIPLTAALTEAFGWRGSARILALILVVIALPLHALVLRRSPHDLGLQPDGRRMDDRPEVSIAGKQEQPVEIWQSVRSREFVVLTMAMTASLLATATVVLFQLPHLIERGIPTGRAAAALGLIGIASLPGRWVLSSLSSRISAVILLAGVTSLMGAAILVLSGAHTLPMVYVYVLLFGIGFGTLQPLRAEVMAQRFGGPAYGQVLGVQGVALALATAGGPLTAGIVRDVSGSYVGIFAVMSTLYFGSSALMLYAHRTFHPRPAHAGIIEYESSTS